MAANVTIYSALNANTRRSTKTDWVAKIKSAFSTWERNYSTRKQLADMDIRLLQDIGLDLKDVREEIAKPFWK